MIIQSEISLGTLLNIKLDIQKTYTVRHLFWHSNSEIPHLKFLWHPLQ